VVALTFVAGLSRGDAIRGRKMRRCPSMIVVKLSIISILMMDLDIA
jgi:hypothetical protein